MKMERLLLSILLLWLVPASASGLESRDALRLKENGIGDETLKVILHEKILETCAFTVSEIIDMKKAGISEETLRMVLRAESFMKGREPAFYGRDVSSSKRIGADDLIRLKNEGFSDEVLRSILERPGSHPLFLDLGVIFEGKTRSHEGNR